MCRKLAVAVLALLCALPALAGSAAPAPALSPSPTCPHSALFELATPAPAPEAASALPDWLEDVSTATSKAHHFRGYCACECSTIKDCNVNADCSNNRCSAAISCC